MPKSFALLFAAILILSGRVIQAATPAGVSARMQAQNAIFTEYYVWWRNAHPEWATIVGDYSVNDRLGDYSLEGVARSHRQAVRFLSRLHAISTTGMSQQGPYIA